MKDFKTIKITKVRNKQLILLIKSAAIVGNLILLFWFSCNRIHEEFKGSIFQKISSVGLIGLLVITIFLLFIRNKQSVAFIRYTASAGNVLILLWILFNGIMEGFKAPLAEKIYYIAVMMLLAINSIVLLLPDIKDDAKEGA